MPAATIIVIGTFRDGYEAVFREYSGKVRAYLARKGGTVVRRQAIAGTLYGEGRSDLFMAIDFPSREVAASAFFEQDYLDLLPLRDQVFSSFRMYLAEAGEI